MRMVLWFHSLGFVLILLSSTQSAFAKLQKNRKENNIFYIPIPEEKLIDIITFSIENILKMYEEAQIKKNQEELMHHFDEMERQMKQVQDSINNIQMEITKLGIAAVYSDKEMAIVNCLAKYSYFVSKPDDQDKKKAFMEKARTLDDDIRELMLGLLGYYRLGPDILSGTRDILEVRNKLFSLKLNSFVCTSLPVSCVLILLFFHSHSFLFFSATAENYEKQSTR